MAGKETIQFDDFAKLDLRVATVLEVEPHPNADRLLKLQIDLGDERRQICAGIREFVDPQALVGKQIVVVANLAPRKIRGEESNGMLLAASVTSTSGDGETDQPSDIVPVQPMKEVPAGSGIS